MITGYDLPASSEEKTSLYDHCVRAIGRGLRFGEHGWDGFTVHYRYRETTYHIKVVQGHAGEDKGSVTVDGVVQREQTIPLVDDHREHFVGVVVMPIRLSQV